MIYELHKYEGVYLSLHQPGASIQTIHWLTVQYTQVLLLKLFVLNEWLRQEQVWVKISKRQRQAQYVGHVVCKPSLDCEHHSPASWLLWFPGPEMFSDSVFAVFISHSVIVFRDRMFPLGGLVPAFTTTNPPNQHTEAGSGITELRRVCVSVCYCVCSCTFDTVKTGQRLKPLQWRHFCEVS